MTTCRSVCCSVLVKVHTMALPPAVAAASSVTVRLTRSGVAVPPAPRPVQAISVTRYVAGRALSVTVVAVPAALSVCGAPVTAVPAVAVVRVCAVRPLLRPS